MNSAMLSETPVVGNAAILDALPLAVLLVGQDGAVAHANPAAEELFDTSAAVLAKIGLSGIISPLISLIGMVEQVRQNTETMFEHGVELNLLQSVGPLLVDVRATPLAQGSDLVILSLARVELRGLATTTGKNSQTESEGEQRAAQATGDDNLGLAVERQLTEYFAAHEGALPPEGLYNRVVREVERPLLTVSLEATAGNQLKAAKMLGINRNTLRKKIRELDIRVIRGVRQSIDGIE